MKLQDLKVGDKIKYYQGFSGRTVEGLINLINEKTVTARTEGTYYSVNKEAIISVIVNFPKEIPIEHPPKPLSFEFTPTIVDINQPVEDSAYYPHAWTRNYGPRTFLIKGLTIINNKQYDLQFPFDIGLEFNNNDFLKNNKFKITIEKI